MSPHKAEGVVGEEDGGLEDACHKLGIEAWANNHCVCVCGASPVFPHFVLPLSSVTAEIFRCAVSLPIFLALSLGP